MTDRRQKVLDDATHIFDDRPDWITFTRQVLGRDGLVRQTFHTTDELLEFERSAEFKEIQRMAAALRNRTGGQNSPPEPIRVITVRLPASLHAELCDEAHERRTSVNKLCIAKLLRELDDGAAGEYGPEEPASTVFSTTSGEETSPLST